MYVRTPRDSRTQSLVETGRAAVPGQGIPTIDPAVHLGGARTLTIAPIIIVFAVGSEVFSVRSLL